MDKMIPKGHLVLLLSFIQISIKHLHDSIFSVNLSIVILLINLNFFF
jgi:hypothetical protein